MDDPVQKPSLTPVDPFNLPQRAPQPGAPAAPQPTAPDLRFVTPPPSPATPTPPTPTPAPVAPRPMTPPPTPSSAPAPAPAPQKSAPLGPGGTQNQQYTSSIRTMNEDIAKIKTGQQPLGTDVQKTVQPSAPVAPTPMPTPKPQAPQAPGIQASLGQTQRAGEMDRTKTPNVTPPPTPTAPVAPQVMVPPPASSSPARLYILIAIGALLIGSLYWFLSSDSTEVATSTPTPSATVQPTMSPTPAPKNLATLVGGGSEPIALAASGDPSADFWAKINTLTLLGGEFRRLAVTTPAKGASELSPLELMDRFIITYPAELKSLLAGETVIAAYGQKESFDAKGLPVPGAPIKKRLVLISEVKDSAALGTAMKAWEPAMTNALPSLLKYDKAKPGSQSFLDNIYQSQAIRYRNFPWADSSVDYALVKASNNKTYLVISSSRETMFGSIEKLIR